MHFNKLSISLPILSKVIVVSCDHILSVPEYFICQLISGTFSVKCVLFSSSLYDSISYLFIHLSESSALLFTGFLPILAKQYAPALETDFTKLLNVTFALPLLAPVIFSSLPNILVIELSSGWNKTESSY